MRRYAPDDLKFVIDDVTAGDDYAAGVMWHVECGEGVNFPFSRGCSFIRLDASGKIVAVRGGRGAGCLPLLPRAGRASRSPGRLQGFHTPTAPLPSPPPRRCVTWWSLQ